MFPVIFQFLIELIKSPKRGLWATIIALFIVGILGYHHSWAKPEAESAINAFKVEQTLKIDSMKYTLSARDAQILYRLENIIKDLDELKKNLSQTNQNVLEIYKGTRPKR